MGKGYTKEESKCVMYLQYANLNTSTLRMEYMYVLYAMCLLVRLRSVLSRDRTVIMEYRTMKDVLPVAEHIGRVSVCG